MDITKLLDGDKDKGKTVHLTELSKLSDEFYSALPHNNPHRIPLITKKLIAQKQDLCQVRLFAFITS